jgi:hypothetical protein
VTGRTTAKVHKVEILPWSLRCAAAKCAAAPVGMTELRKRDPRAQAGVPVPQEGLVQDDRAGFGYVGVEFVDYVGVLLFDYAAF